MATVKSLEDRIDEMADDTASISKSVAVLASRMDGMQSQVAGVQSQIAIAINAIQTAQAQLSLTTLKLETVVGELGSVKSKLEVVTSDYTAFKSKMDAAYALMKWLGAFAAGAMMSVIATGFVVAHFAGKVENSVEKLNETVQKQEQSNREMEKQISRLQAAKDK